MRDGGFSRARGIPHSCAIFQNTVPINTIDVATVSSGRGDGA